MLLHPALLGPRTPDEVNQELVLSRVDDWLSMAAVELIRAGRDRIKEEEEEEDEEALGTMATVRRNTSVNLTAPCSLSIYMKAVFNT